MLSSSVLPRLSASPLALDFDAFKYEPLQSAVGAAVESPLKTIFATIIPLFATWLLWTVYQDRKLIPGFPVVGQSKGWDLLRGKARKRFLNEGDKVIMEGQERFGKDATFQVTGHSAPILVLPVKYMNEVRNDENLNVLGAATQDFFMDYKPFHSIRDSQENNVIVKTVQKKLTPLLALVTEPVNEENNIAIPKYWPATSEWKEHLFVEQLLLLVSQVSSRIFLGAPICRNEQWIRIAKEYTIDLVGASYAMQYVPRQLRPFIYRWLPALDKLQKSVTEARQIVEPEIQRREKIAAEAMARGEKLPKHLDTIDWMMEVAEGKPYDITAGQLNLSFAAIHTTSTTSTHVMYDIIENNLVDELREEIVQVYREDGGWAKTSLYKLKLLDSVMKESQRINALSAMSMTRYALKDVTLSNGEVIPKGTRCLTPNLHLWDEDYYENANKFDGKRFLRLREQPGNANKYQYVAPTLEHNSFGLGTHSCPGRFFASNEIKLILAHLLIKFDWKFIDGVRPPKAKPHSGSNLADPTKPIMYKSRTPEIEF